MRSNGKSTEKETEDRLYALYGSSVLIDRLPDKFDTGNYQDIRPSDFIIIFGEGIEPSRAYIECKETSASKMSLGFSRFRKGQWQAMRRCYRLKVPYFVVFGNLKTDKMYLIPASVIVEAEKEGKRSLSEDVVLNYLWQRQEKLYDYTKDAQPNG